MITQLARESSSYYQILPTNSLRKCMEISLENLYVDTGLKAIDDIAALLVVLLVCPFL